MNWHNTLGSSETANLILFTGFHSLWISLLAYLIIQVRQFRSPAIRSIWCTVTLLLLLTLPVVTFVPRIGARVKTIQRPSFSTQVASTESKVPLISTLLTRNPSFSQTHAEQLKQTINLFGLIWIAVALCLVGKLSYELAYLKGYCSGLQEVQDDRIRKVLDETNKSFGFRKKPKCFISHRLTSPISMGLFTPLVILPADLYRQIDDGELRAILLHELAHIYHYDHLLGLVQRLCKSLFWWNPITYLLSKWLSISREEVCDNHAISAMENAKDYASLLIGLIEKTSLISRMPCTASMATPYESMEIRIKNILSKERDMRVSTKRSVRFAALATAAVLFGLVYTSSQMKVFGQGSSYSGNAKPILVDIKNVGTNLKMDMLQGSKLVLQAPETNKLFESSSIRINNNEGSCEFVEPIAPGSYKLLMNMFAISADVVIPETPYPALPLHVTIAPGLVSVFADLVLRSDRANAPQSNPVQLDPSNSPIVLSQAELEYPENARLAKISGIVKAEVVVNERGEVYEAKLLAGHPWFQHPALAAVLQWRYQPMLVNGQAQPFVTTATLSFHY